MSDDSISPVRAPGWEKAGEEVWGGVRGPHWAEVTERPSPGAFRLGVSSTASFSQHWIHEFQGPKLLQLLHLCRAPGTQWAADPATDTALGVGLGPNQTESRPREVTSSVSSRPKLEVTVIAQRWLDKDRGESGGPGTSDRELNPGQIRGLLSLSSSWQWPCQAPGELTGVPYLCVSFPLASCPRPASHGSAPRMLFFLRKDRYFSIGKEDGQGRETGFSFSVVCNVVLSSAAR